MTDSRNSAQNFPIFTRVPSSALTTKKSNLKLIKVNGIQELEANSPANKLDQAVVKFCELGSLEMAHDDLEFELDERSLISVSGGGIGN